MKKLNNTIICLALLFLFSPVADAEKKFEHSSMFKMQQIIMQSLPDTTNKQQLIQKARKNGFIKVWVFYAMDYIPEGNLDGIQIAKQREVIQIMHRQFINDIERQKFHVWVTNKPNGEPRIAMLVDEKALEFFYTYMFVQKVIEVELGRIFSN